MADNESRQEIQESSFNWTAIALGALLLAIVVAVIANVWLRVVVAVAALAFTIYLGQLRETTEIENPLLEQLRERSTGLDRRKYGRLRTFTDRMLEHVRAMNRIAIDAREGKMSQRYAHAEMDRIAAMMRDLTEEIRKSAGVPTPEGEPPPKRPTVVQPKAGPTRPRRPSGPGGEYGAPESAPGESSPGDSRPRADE